MKLRNTLCAGLALCMLLTVPALAAPEETGETQVTGETAAATYTQEELDALIAAAVSAARSEAYTEGYQAAQDQAAADQYVSEQGVEYDDGYSDGYAAAMQEFQSVLEANGGMTTVTNEDTGSQTVSAGTGFDVSVILPEVGDTVIDVRVPSSGHILVNPYGLEVAAGDGVTTDQVVSSALTIANYSEVALEVTASAVGSFNAGSDAQFVTMPTAVNGGKRLFLFFEFWTGAESGAPWTGAWSGERNQLAVNGGAAQVMTMDAAQDESTPSLAVFRAFGAAGVPDEGAWSTDDTLGVSLTFTFTPVA